MLLIQLKLANEKQLFIFKGQHSGEIKAEKKSTRR